MNAPQDKLFMLSAIAAAEAGRGSVEPNPMVGAIIARDAAEIARGWHRRFGGPHAEIEALAAARAAGIDVRGATMYVSLEPCCHHGKTPPCTEALIAAGLSRVVVAMLDPDDRVSGRGVERLRQAGIEVVVGVCEAEARSLLRAYVKLRTRGRCWVICKWAQTSDGYLALSDGAGRWVSSAASRRHVHWLRSWCDAICVGAATVRVDDPMLDNRSGAGRQPVRIVLDSRLGISPASRLVQTAGQSPVVIATTQDAAARCPESAAVLRDAGAEVLPLPASADGVDLGALLDELGRRQMTYLLVEGGERVLRSFIRQRLADELMVFISPDSAATDADLPRFDIAEVSRELNLAPAVEQARFDNDLMLRYLL